MNSAKEKCSGCGVEIYPSRFLSFQSSGTAYICAKCRHWHVGFQTPPPCCLSCGGSEMSTRSNIPPLCPACTEKLEEADEIVRQGGVYWSCSGCRSEGILKPEHPLAVKLRSLYQVKPPDPVFLMLENCPHCRECAEEASARVDTTPN